MLVVVLEGLQDVFEGTERKHERESVDIEVRLRLGSFSDVMRHTALVDP